MIEVTKDFVESIEKKAIALYENISRRSQLNFVGPSFPSVRENIHNMVVDIVPKLEQFSLNPIFWDDFKLALITIDTAMESFLRFLNLNINRPKQSFVSQFRVAVDLFSVSIKNFTNIYLEISKEYIKNPTSHNLQLRLGLESALFSFACKTESIDVSPFYKSNMINMYSFYSHLMGINKTVVPVFKSVCGSGKTLCIPWIMLCRCLKENMQTPFFLITGPSPKHILPKEEFFNQRISKYVNVTSDPDKLIEYYKNADKLEKPVFGLLMPHNLLPLMHSLKNIENFYDITRIMIDEIHQRTFHLDVLVAKIGNLNREGKLKLPANVSISSATIDNSFISSLGPGAIIHELSINPQYEIVVQNPIIESDLRKINNEIIHNETVKTIRNMALDNSQIEEGHILCFCSGIGICYKLRSAVCSCLNNTNETNTSRKIVILQTTLKPNESIESYFRRLTIEFERNEGLREGKGYKKEFLYIVPIVLSGLVDDVIYELAQKDFSGKLSSINKLICSTAMIESSFTIDRLSVVIDSGLCKEAGFDLSTCLTTMTEKQTSWQSMDQRKGRLGRTIKGLYIPIHAPPKDVLDVQIPPICRTDLSTNILLMKDIDIDFETIKFLPTTPNKQNLEFGFNTLASIKAIDNKTKKITPFGHELLNYPYVSIYYAAAVLNFRGRFEEKQIANFIGAYLVTVIAMENLLLQEESTEKLSLLFCVDSDISTLINALNPLLMSSIEDNDKMREEVELYGFSYSSFLTLKSHLQEYVDLIFPGESIKSVITKSGGFVRKNGGIITLMDKLIENISNTYPKWRDTHFAQFSSVDGVGGFDSNPIIKFKGNECLKFPYQRNNFSEIRINKRPGWNGIAIPDQIYCLNVSRNMNYRCNNGSLIHRCGCNLRKAIETIEAPKLALSPWFKVLHDSYYDESISYIKYFENYRSHDRIPFHYSSTGGRVFISFVPKTLNAQKLISDGCNQLIKLMPFTPRSVLIYRDEAQSVVEVFSVGTEHYESIISGDVKGNVLDRTSIDYCLKNINLLARSTPIIRIGAGIIDPKCLKQHFIPDKLFFVSSIENISHINTSPLKNVLKRHQIEIISNEHEDYPFHSYENKLRLYQFPSKFIHPALIYHQESKEKIIKWFDNCPYAKNFKIIGHSFLMEPRQIRDLQSHLRYDKQKILREMNLTYTAVPVTLTKIEKLREILALHLDWCFDDRFKVIVAPIKDVTNVQKALQECENGDKTESEAALCCFYICDDPDSPILTQYPITVYYKDGNSITKKMCRDCMISSLEASTESFYDGVEVDQTILEELTMKPAVIPSLPSEEDGFENWPQIPLGQMVTSLIYNDQPLSGLISAWLNAVGEYTLRVAKDKFTFCPEHPHLIFCIDDFNKIQNIDGSNIICKTLSCYNAYCKACMGWHKIDNECEELKNGKTSSFMLKCPKCLVPTFKDGGCNHITCPCGCHWCYKCMAGFTNANSCYEHLSAVHGGCFDYNFD